MIPEIKENFEIFDGGPVEKENLYFVHNVPDLIKNSIEIKENLYWGGNFEHVVELTNKKKTLKLLIRATILSLSYIIKSYQVAISPLLGKNCRFHPTCSNYALEALKKKGLLVGVFLSIKRILKCNPFFASGYDPVD